MIKRRPHLLTPNKRTFKPQYHIFFDIETDVGEFKENSREHTFKLGWALFWRRRGGGFQDTLEWYEIEDQEAFWEWVEWHANSKSRLLLIAHNVEYDAFILGAFHILPKRGWELTRFYTGSQVAIYSWRKGSKTIQFVDNGNWFKGPLKGWGEVVGYSKLEVDPLTADRESLRLYCRRDVEILYQLWLWWYEFCKEHDLGTWGITLPSQAFLAYRHRFMEYPIYIHNDYDVLQLERFAYHGGRTECFQAGEFTEGPFYKVDVNSMYPWVMQNNQYPISLRGQSEKSTLANLRHYLSKYMVIAEVDLFTPKPYFPSTFEGRLVYPAGLFRTILTTPELTLALEKGWIERVYRVCWYSKAPIFQDYVDYFYQLKERYKRGGNLLRFRLAKLMLNSLYGKFGQRATKMKQISECDPHNFKRVTVYDPAKNRYGVEYYLGGKVWWAVKSGESYHSFPAIAAHVTAYARIHLYKLVEAVGRDNCYYCDTDSLIINQTAYERLEPFIQPYTLGMLKLEKTTNYLKINAPKDYVLGEDVVIKGVKKDAVWLDDHTVEQEVFPSIRGLMQRGEGKTYKTFKQVKVLKREIKSGYVGQDGRIYPWGSASLL